MLSVRIALEIAATTALATVGGIALASQTVGDMRSDTYGYRASMQSELPICTNCSERELGAAWAASESIASSTRCENASWEFRQGCEDFFSR